MNYRLYIDTFWITLWLVDMVAMMGTVYLLKYQTRFLRCVILSAISAGIEVLLYVFLPYYWLYRVLMLCLVNPLLVIGLLYPLRRMEYLRGYFLITGLLFVIGGIQTLFYYWVPLQRGVGIWQILMAGLAVLLCLLQRRRGKVIQNECEVDLQIGGHTISLLAYHDTGNLLRDPFTGKPVSILDKSILADSSLNIEKLRYIPYHTVGQEHGLMQVLTIEEMTIKQGNRRIRMEQPVIGLSENRLFLKQDIHMILHSELL